MISAGAGALSSGLSAFGGRGTRFAISTGIEDATESVLKQANEGEDITLSQTVSDAASNKVGGLLTRNVVDTKVLSKEASRTAQVSANDPSSSGRAARAETAKAALTKAKTTNKVNQVVGAVTSGVAGNAIQNTSNAIRAQSASNRSYLAPTNTAPSDAIRVHKPLIIEKE